MAVDLKQLKQDGATTGQVVAWSGTTWVPQTGAGTLDTAYDFGGSGAGRVITADSGAVHIDKPGVNANNALEVSVTAGSGAALSVSMGATTSGPALYANAVTGATGVLIQLQTNATDRFSVTPTGVPFFTDNGSLPYLVTAANSNMIGSFDSRSVARFYFAGTPTGMVWQLGTSRGTNAAPSAVLNNDLLGQWEAPGYIGATSGHATMARIKFYVDGSPVDGASAPGRIVLHTVPSGALAGVDRHAVVNAGHFQSASSLVHGWTGSPTDPSTALTSGFSQLSAATVALGDGTAGNATGTMRLTTLQAPAATALNLGAAAATQWQITTAGHQVPQTDNVYDIGVSATNRIRTLYAGTSVVVGATIAIDGSSVQRTSAGTAALFTDALTTTVTIGGGATQTSMTLGRAGQTATFLGFLSSPGAGTDSERFGSGALAAGGDSLAAGRSASASAFGTTALGKNAVASGAFSISIAAESLASDSGSIAIGYDSTSSASSAIAFGDNAVASAIRAVAFGPGSTSAFTGSMAFGTGAITTATGQVVFGSTSHTLGDLYLGTGVAVASPFSFTIHPSGGLGAGVAGATILIAGGTSGDAATAGGSVKLQTARAGSGTTLTDAVTISNTGTISCLGAGGSSERFGAGTTAAGASALAVGNGASSAASHSLAIGATASVGSTASDSLAVGYGATIFNSASAAQSTAVGVGASAGSAGAFGTAFGNGANAENGIAIGVNAVASGNAISIGTNASSTFQGSIVIAYNNGATTATNQFVVGADQPGSRIDDTYIGKGVESATPSAFVSIHATNGVGTDIAASALVLASGVSTGSASPADCYIKTTYPGTTGSTAQTTNARYQARGKPVTLVNNTATEIFNIDVPNNTGRIGVTIQYTVVYDDGTDYQTETGFVTLSATQVSATYFTSTAKFGNAQAVSSGTLTVTASVTNNTNNISLKLNANSSLTPTTLRCFVQVLNNSDKDPVFA